MKALTIWQPWASLIVEGHKPFEFRKWRAYDSIIGKRIAIHAGARKARPVELRNMIDYFDGGDRQWLSGLQEGAKERLEFWLSNPTEIQYSAVLGTAILGEPTRNQEDVAGVLGGKINDSDRDEEANWAWPMLHVERFDEPVPCKGAQGLWNWRDEESA